ncbi:MAG: ArsA-related P-loop ATPase [Myxococcota bacterium]|nr:ArsA-related P-loop ATPase [Myxococcota bacterium]
MSDDASTTIHDPIAPLLESARLIVCCGPGGVGKTTTAAALGLRGVLMGRKVIVLTIDPAKRLANSLGLSELSNTPQQIDLRENLAQVPDSLGDGEFWAMMLDQKKTLDDLVRKYAPDPGALERAEKNNIYRLLSSTLHGMQEYMALDKLHDLYTGGYFDLVVLDTPPTKNALEFLETPSRAKTFFDERIIKWFLPNRRAGFFGRVLDPGSIVLKLLGRIFGDTFVTELTEFFETLEFLQQALQSRGEMIDYIMRDQQTHFFVITSADPRRMKEALFFHEKLAELGQRAEAFIINRVIPPFNPDDLQKVDADAIAKLAENAQGLDSVDRAQFDALRKDLESTYKMLARLAVRDQDAIEDLSKSIGAGALRRVPLLGQDVHSIEQLVSLSEFLTPSKPVYA